MARALLFIAAVGCTDYTVAPISDPSDSNWFDEASEDMRSGLGPEDDAVDTGWADDTGFAEEEEPPHIDDETEDETEDEDDVEDDGDDEGEGFDDETDDSGDDDDSAAGGG